MDKLCCRFFSLSLKTHLIIYLQITQIKCPSLTSVPLNIITGLDNLLNSCDLTIVTREKWGARPSKEINYMGTPVGVVFIHHTNMKACTTQDECIEEMKVIQNFHMDDRGSPRYIPHIFPSIFRVS